MYKPAILLPFLLLPLLLGLALAEQPVNVPNFLIVSSPVLELGLPLNGELTSDDGQNFKDGSYLDIYVFRGTEGELTTVDLISPDFDTTLTMYSPSGQLVEFNDDNDMSTNSTINLELFESGTFLVVVSSFDSFATGDYTVSRTTPVEMFEGEEKLEWFEFDFADLPEAIPLEIPLIKDLSGNLGELDEPVTFNFEEGDPTNTSWKYVDRYSFNLNESRLTVIEVSAQDFDTFLYLFDDRGNVLDIHDDSNPVFTTDSQITAFLEPGTYEVLITSFDEGELGDYELRIDLFRPE